MERVEAAREFGRQPEGLVDREPPPSLIEPILERSPLGVEDREVDPAVGLPGVDDRNEVRMPHLGRGPRFLREALVEDLVLEELALQHLQRDDLAVAPPGAEDQPHSALAEHRLEAVVAETVAALQLRRHATS